MNVKFLKEKKSCKQNKFYSKLKIAELISMYNIHSQYVLYLFCIMVCQSNLTHIYSEVSPISDAYSEEAVLSIIVLYHYSFMGKIEIALGKKILAFNSKVHTCIYVLFYYNEV